MTVDAFRARQVEAMAGYGIPARDIAIALGVERWELERDYSRELAGAAIKANSKVAESLYRKATGEGKESVIAAIFWLKTRAGWRETSIHEIHGHGQLSLLSDEELDMKIELLLRRVAETAGDGGRGNDPTTPKSAIDET